MHKDLNTLLNTDIAKTVNIYPALNKQLVNVSVKSSKWMIDDVRNIVKNYSKSIENYRAFYDDIKSLYEMSALKNKDKNKVFNYGYYLVESMCGLFSTLYSSIMSTCMSVVDAYEIGVKNSYDQTDIDKLMLSPTMDDFLGEDEGTEKDNKDGDDHLKSADESFNASAARTNTNNSGLKALPADASESKSVSREVYNILSKHSSYYAFARKMNNAMRAMDTGHQVPEMLRVANKYPKVLQKFATMDFGISLKDGESLKKNANSVREMLDCIGLHLLVCKQYFNTNNVLLLDATHANPDTMEEFKKQDGSMEDINLHLLHRYILPNQPVPNMGIRISEIIRNKQNVAMEHMKRTESIKDKVRINHDGASILAYTRVLNDYLKEIPEEYIPKGMTRNNFIAMKYSLVKATSQYLNNKDHTVDECIYRFLLKLKYADKPMYQDMYNKMEIQYRRLAESADDTITMSDKATADAKVVSDIVMNFLFDYFVEK